MKRVLWQIDDCSLSEQTLIEIKHAMSLEERQAIDDRLKMLDNHFFDTHKDRIFAKHMFELGYLAAHTYKQNELPSET